MNGKVVGYWVTTVIPSLALLGSGIGYLTGGMLGAMTALGYPVYFTYLLGIWKILGVIALLAPGFGRIKEWAYAGFFFTLTGAFVSHVGTDGLTGEAFPPLVMLALLIGSYVLRPASRRI